MTKRLPNLIVCRKQQLGTAVGRLCAKFCWQCDDCAPYVRPSTPVRVRDECNHGSFQGQCGISGGVSFSGVIFGKELGQQERDRDCFPKM
ncbi:PHD finger-like domain-containing protein 5A [Physcomitrium patens]|uniref:Uncharacterized protein n=1 Tax=Physcomitrium patens TaxID=3218 RepID=A0A7I4EQ31_PHYPA